VYFIDIQQIFITSIANGRMDIWKVIIKTSASLETGRSILKTFDTSDVVEFVDSRESSPFSSSAGTLTSY